uniref:M48 family metallopeptidase n=1 Tax=uncultured Erythrobacter sp. TaxID=263913 RepID=UPI00262BC618|nr:M48 family metallopeptidase [uncultured Erythrobacter sp.]
MAFDPRAATEAHMASLSSAELELARDYTTGNHWLMLLGLIVSAVVTIIIVKSGILDKVAAKLERRGFALRTWVVAAVYLIVSTVIALPVSIYTDWWRETQYDRTSQPIADYLSQSAIGTALSTVLGALFFLGVYWLIRKTGQLWWAWSGALVAGAVSFMLLLSPILIEPLFNDYKPIPEGEVRTAVLELASEAGVPEDRVFMFDGSRQSNNFTANVSGVGNSARIAISDVALGEASLDEVKAVTGHEIGHYMLGHVWRIVFVLSALAIAVFWLTSRSYGWFARAFGSDAAIDDPRGIPVLLFVIGLFSTLGSPVTNTLTRVGERESDQYSLDTVGLPDALSEALVKTAEYRFPLAGPIEETLFYTHPTVKNRVRSAMDWKAENLAAIESESGAE